MEYVMTKNAIIGGRIREARRAREMTQDQLSNISGVPQTTISKLEANRRQGCTCETAIRLCAALGICEEEVGTLAAFLRSPSAATINDDELGMLVAIRAGRDSWRRASHDAWVLALSAARQALASR